MPLNSNYGFARYCTLRRVATRTSVQGSERRNSRYVEVRRLTAIMFHMATKPTSKAEGKCICKLESWHFLRWRAQHSATDQPRRALTCVDLDAGARTILVDRKCGLSLGVLHQAVRTAARSCGALRSRMAPDQ